MTVETRAQMDDVSTILTFYERPTVVSLTRYEHRENNFNLH